MQVFISSSARDSRQAFIASFVLSRASSTVSHCETQPGNPEQLAMYLPTSSRMILKLTIEHSYSLLK